MGRSNNRTVIDRRSGSERRKENEHGAKLNKDEERHWERRALLQQACLWDTKNAAL